VETTVQIVHLLAAAVWVGGTVALVFVGVPVVRTLEGEARMQAMRTLGRRWRPLGWGAMAVLVASGLVLAHEHGALRREALDTDFGTVLLAKSLLVVVLVAGALMHDFVLGPRLQREIRAGEPPRTRRPLIAVGWVTFALTIAVPILGGVLVSMLQ